MSVSMPKRRRVDESDVQAASASRLPRGAETILQTIDSQLNANRDVEDVNCSVDLSSMIDAIPYARLLSDIPQHSTAQADIPLVPRAYEERFMRECVSSAEKPCIMGSSCECMLIDPAQPFVGVQYHIPGSPQEEATMCLLCVRKHTHILFYKTVHIGIGVPCLIQKFGNICNQEGEYHPSAMLICPPNGPVHSMPYPVVAHQRNKYSVHDVQGVKYIRQNRVAMQDF